MSTPAIERFISAAVEELIKNGDPIGVEEQVDPELHTLEAEVQDLAVRMEGLGELFADGTLSAEQVRRAKARIAKRREEIEARLDRDAHRRQSRRTLIPMIEAWDQADREQQGMVIRALLILQP